ncbi:MAG: hypothetical protein KDJ66_04835, partial [Nitratireductor sp.]|nr:hypothetical protein [Nitratireductor sp.]
EIVAGFLASGALSKVFPDIFRNAHEVVPCTVEQGNGTLYKGADSGAVSAMAESHARLCALWDDARAKGRT